MNGKKVESADLREKDRLVIGEFVLEVAIGRAEGTPPPGLKGGISKTGGTTK